MASKQLSSWDIESLVQVTDHTDPNDDALADADGRHVRAYDFRRPSRFSRDHLRALQSIHESFARGVASILTSYLRLNVRVQLAAVEQALFDEYVGQLPSMTVAFILRVPPLEGPLVLELGNPLILAALDRLCGGSGQVGSHDRPLTAIEQALLQPLGRHLLRAFADAWSSVVRLRPTVEDIQLNPRLMRVVAADDVVALVILHVTIGEVSGTISVCLPHLTLDPVMDRLHSRVWLAGQSQSESGEIEQSLRSRLQDVTVEAVIELGDVDLPTNGVLTLREGDVIRLQTPATADLLLMVGDRPLFRCRPGLSNGNVAVQITDDHPIQSWVPSPARADSAHS